MRIIVTRGKTALLVLGLLQTPAVLVGLRAAPSGQGGGLTLTLAF
jgi:hypothetical protein